MFKKQGDNKKNSEPEYQVYPCRDFDRESNTDHSPAMRWLVDGEKGAGKCRWWRPSLRVPDDGTGLNSRDRKRR